MTPQSAKRMHLKCAGHQTGPCSGRVGAPITALLRQHCSQGHFSPVFRRRPVCGFVDVELRLKRGRRKRCLGRMRSACAVRNSNIPKINRLHDQQRAASRALPSSCWDRDLARAGPRESPRSKSRCQRLRRMRRVVLPRATDLGTGIRVRRPPRHKCHWNVSFGTPSFFALTRFLTRTVSTRQNALDACVAFH